MACRVHAGVEAVAAVPVEAEGRVFRLGDIATVSRGVADPQSYAARYNGEDTILLGVAMSEGGNVLELGERLHEKAAEIKARLGVSKNAYKQAIGRLYKRRLIIIEDSGVRLAPRDAGTTTTDDSA